MASLRKSTLPTILHPISLAAFIQHVLHRNSNFTDLIICSSQPDFLNQLLTSISYSKQPSKHEAAAAGFSPDTIERMASAPHHLLIPTIQQLSRSTKVSVTFCETVPQLQAHLATYALRNEVDRSSTMALINPLSLHRDTPSFSAQGLSRTFASAVEAALRWGQRLVVVECPSRDHDASLMLIDDGEEEEEMNREEIDPWEEEISILNVATKSFGAGEKGWVGRTVKTRRIAERWCTFEQP